MISVYRVFQMIFGAIVSFFILYFLIQYSGTYAGLQQNVQKVEILKSLREQIKQVYTSGIYEQFNYTKRYDFSSCYLNVTSDSIPKIMCDFPSGIPIITPALFYAGEKEKVIVSRGSTDYGWWVFYFVEVMPGIEIIFSPLEENEQTWNFIRDIVYLFPDTSDGKTTVKIKFDFCDNEPLKLCNGKACERSDFLNVLELPHNYGFSPCSFNPKKNQRIVVIADSCKGKGGLCLELPNRNGVGSLYFRNKRFVYKDPADILCFVLAGNKEDILGIPLAERMYEYKNTILMERLGLFSEEMKLSYEKTKKEQCESDYLRLINLLGKISRLPKNYLSFTDMNELNENLFEAKQIYESLIERGCEYG